MFTESLIAAQFPHTLPPMLLACAQFTPQPIRLPIKSYREKFKTSKSSWIGGLGQWGSVSQWGMDFHSFFDVFRFKFTSAWWQFGYPCTIASTPQRNQFEFISLTLQFEWVFNPEWLRFRIIFTPMSPRCHLDFTSTSLRLHFDFLGINIDFMWIARLFPFDVSSARLVPTPGSLRSSLVQANSIDVFSNSLQSHFGFTSSPPDSTSIPLRRNL